MDDPTGIRDEIERLGADAAFWFASGRVHEASIAWHSVIGTLLPLVTSKVSATKTLTSELTAAGTELTTTTSEIPATPLQGSFVVIPVASIASSSSDGSQLLLSSKIASEDRTFALHASAIHYVSPGWGVRGLVDDDMAIVATAVYNLGLCHHLHAILNESRAPELCEKALRAYHASQRILEGSGLCYVVPPPTAENGNGTAAVTTAATAAVVEHHLRFVCLLRLALVNNAGHAYELLNCRDEAQQQLTELHALLASQFGEDDFEDDVDLDLDGGGEDGRRRRRYHRRWTFHAVSGSGSAEQQHYWVPFLTTVAMYPIATTIARPAPCA